MRDNYVLHRKQVEVKFQDESTHLAHILAFRAGAGSAPCGGPRSQSQTQPAAPLPPRGGELRPVRAPRRLGHALLLKHEGKRTRAAGARQVRTVGLETWMGRRRKSERAEWWKKKIFVRQQQLVGRCGAGTETL